jgi:hypothetical protein
VRADAQQLYNHEGDIGVWMLPAKHLDLFQTQLISHTAKIKTLGLIQPFWGESVSTWDDDVTPLTVRAFCRHVEPLRANTDLPPEYTTAPHILVILRPTAALLNSTGRPLVRDFYESFQLSGDRYNISFLEVDQYHYGLTESIYPMIGLDQTVNDYLDITSHTFFSERKYNCSSLTAWSILVAMYYQTEDTAVRQGIIDSLGPDNAVAVDLTTPGVLCWYLVRHKLARIVTIIDFGATLTQFEIDWILMTGGG